MTWLAIIGIVLVVGLLVALFNSRSWRGVLAALFGLLLLAFVLGGSLFIDRVRMHVGEIAVMPPTPGVQPPNWRNPPPPAKPTMPSAPPPALAAEAPEAEAAEAPASRAQVPLLNDDEAKQHAQWADWQTWTAAGSVRLGDVYRMPVEIGPYVTRAECDAEQPKILREAVRRYANQLLGEGAGEYVDLPLPYIFQKIVRADCEELRETSVGRMLYVHNLLEFDRATNYHINREYKQSLVAERLKYAGLGAAGLFGLLATVYAYLKLDTLSRGYYAGRLQLAAAVAILGLLAGLLAGA